MKRRNFMVRLTYRDAAGEMCVEHSDRQARTPQEAIRNAIRAKRSSTPRVRIYGTAAHQYVVL